ncbi:MAG: hypothetical protein FD167_4156, partial [bacterium]
MANLSENKTSLIIDPWAQPATKEAVQKMPEI